LSISIIHTLMCISTHPVCLKDKVQDEER